MNYGEHSESLWSGNLLPKESSITHYHIALEVIGWSATALFVSSFLVKKRSLLHFLGFTACILKMIYSYEYHVWPLFANWVILFFIDIYQWYTYHKKDKTAPVAAEATSA